MKQPVARYSPADLPRVVARDFAGQEAVVERILAGYPGGKGTGDGGLRVRMACLKLARGDLGRLERLVTVARGDFRDVLSAAEYPAYMRAGSREKHDEAICADWQQLQAWLHATEPQRVDENDPDG